MFIIYNPIRIYKLKFNRWKLVENLHAQKINVTEQNW